MKFHKQEVAKRCDNLMMKLIKQEIDDMDKGSAVAVALYVRYLKRINAHLKNIATSLVNPLERIGYQEAKKKVDEPSEGT
jgi:hypothetical protein